MGMTGIYFSARNCKIIILIKYEKSVLGILLFDRDLLEDESVDEFSVSKFESSLGGTQCVPTSTCDGEHSQ